MTWCLGDRQPRTVRARAVYARLLSGDDDDEEEGGNDDDGGGASGDDY